MFTGIVQDCSRVAGLRPSPSGVRLELDLPAGWSLQPGESVAVNGCCLTALPGLAAAFDLSPETLARTSLGSLKPGDGVNVEKALRAGDALGGHFMAGHVDGLATLREIQAQGEGAQWRLEVPEGLHRYVASKGSVALDGVSLTPFDVQGTAFSVALIPHTLKASNLGKRKVNDRLNLEVDLLARYLLRFMETDPNAHG
jgi:riboflavin synthase